MWSRYKKAARTIVLDSVPERLQMAKDKFGAETMNIKEFPDVVGRFREICPGGADGVIDATGFRCVLVGSGEDLTCFFSG